MLTIGLELLKKSLTEDQNEMADNDIPQKKSHGGLGKHIQPARTPGELSITEKMLGGDRHAEIMAEQVRDERFPKNDSPSKLSTPAG